MNLSKLFGVLVVGGALLTTGCDEGERSGVEEKTGRDPDAAQTPSADAAITADATVLPDGNALQPCLCDTQACCQDSILQEGFVCCWGTTC